MNITKIPHQEITYKIIGAAMKVHNRMPRGLKERHYQRALQADCTSIRREQGTGNKEYVRSPDLL